MFNSLRTFLLPISDGHLISDDLFQVISNLLYTKASVEIRINWPLLESRFNKQLLEEHLFLLLYVGSVFISPPGYLPMLKLSVWVPMYRLEKGVTQVYAFRWLKALGFDYF